MRTFNALAISLIAISTGGALVSPLAATKVAENPIAVVLPTPADKPPYSAYKGVTIGTKTDEARAKLGGPKEKSDEQDFFEFSSREAAQVYYDAATHSVTAVMVTYSGKLDGVPTPRDVFGEDAEAKPDGGIFKMVRYPKAGFWISYNKTAGDDPMVIIALNKM